MSFLIPVERLRETPRLLAFYHPRPQYPVHILIVPKKSIASMVDLTAEDGLLLVEVFQIVSSLVEELGLKEQGYRLITNGGHYQDVQQLHFHLVS
ncbi:MAG: HIT domain-containing protein [Chloroflexi bacterium]|nr:HIT domain-containing protein [Chloroflexota bacterium]